jgi:hypothetical protein
VLVYTLQYWQCKCNNYNVSVFDCVGFRSGTCYFGHSHVMCCWHFLCFMWCSLHQHQVCYCSIFALFSFLYHQQNIYQTWLWVARWLSYKNPELLTIHEHMGSSKMAPCKVECHVETLCSSSRLATEEFEDTKGVIRICILKKNRQHNGQKKKYKRTNNDLQKYTYKTKDWVTQTPLKIGGDLRCFGRVSSSCSTNDTRHVNLVTNLW